MIPIPAERRVPSLALAACAAAMPLVLYGLPFIVFEGLCGGRHPPIPLQYWTFAAVIVCQWLAYACGIRCLWRLWASCPPPATRIGKWFTGSASAAFIVLGGVWCGLCAVIFLAMTVIPW